MSDNNTYELAILARHPVPYAVPIYKHLDDNSPVNPTVYYCKDFGAREQAHHPKYDVEFQWEKPLLEGYNYEFLENYPQDSLGRWGELVNPSIVRELYLGNFDALWVTGYNAVTPMLGFLIAKMTGIPLVFRGEMALRDSSGLPKRAIKTLVYHTLFSLFDAILYSFEKNKQFYEYYGICPGKLFFCPSSVDNQYFRESFQKLRSERSQLREKHGIPEDHFVFLTVSQLTPRKRPMNIVRAFEKADLAGSTLVLVGSGEKEQKIRSHIEENDVDNIIIEGFKPRVQLPVFYTLTDCFVLASEYDPSPKVLHEAMNFENSVLVSSGVATAPELVEDGDNGFVFEKGNISQLAKCMRLVSHDEQNNELMGQRSLDIVNEWSIERSANAVETAVEYVTGD